jgi:nitrilase
MYLHSFGCNLDRPAPVFSYPDWIWRSRPWDEAPELFGRLLRESVVVPGPITQRLGRLAARVSAYLAIGVSERDLSGSTLYNTLLVFDPRGKLVIHRRKLMPTGPERMVWGMGDGSTLTVVDTPFSRLGGLICWENYMPLARAAMYAQGIDILVAPTSDRGDTWVSTLRHIGREGRVFVVGVASCIRGSDVPPDLLVARACMAAKALAQRRLVCDRRPHRDFACRTTR